MQQEEEGATAALERKGSLNNQGFVKTVIILTKEKSSQLVTGVLSL